MTQVFVSFLFYSNFGGHNIHFIEYHEDKNVVNLECENIII